MSPYALFVAFVLAVCVGLGIGVLFEAIDRWSRRSERSAPSVGLAIFAARTAADIAADTLARQKRQDELDAWTRATRVEFEKAMKGRPFLAAIRAESEAADLDSEWKRIQQNGWAAS